MEQAQSIVVFGASGYVGGRLIPALLDRGHSVRAVTRHRERLDGFPWRASVEIVEADALEPETLNAALDGVDAIYYLVHSMGTEDFAARDRTAARNVARAAEHAGVRRIIYLGGLGDGELSEHLASRQEVGRELASGATPVVELRAAVVLGSGSLSFEMLRYLTEVLPVMTTPRWVKTKVQPIAIVDVLHYLASALDVAVDDHHTILEIGGPDVVTYAEMMQRYAAVAGLRRRLIIPLPFLSPGLSSLWVGLVTPIQTLAARQLIQSLANEVVVRDRSASAVIDHEPLGLDAAVRRALHQTMSGDVPTRWSEPDWRPAEPLPTDPDYAGGTLQRDRREQTSAASQSDLYWAVSRIGGGTGYYGVGWAWTVRGWLDQAVGGAGLRRGRRHPERLRLGESIDFWRVVAIEAPHRVVLKADMRLPGEAWLEWEVVDEGTRRVVRQIATFAPRGLWGRVYWWLLVPFHAIVFPRMLGGIVDAAERRAVLQRSA